VAGEAAFPGTWLRWVGAVLVAVSLLVVVTKDLVGRLKAGELIKEMATEVGGTGGGRPEMAQAGGKNPEGLGTALEKVFGLVQKALEG